VASDSFGSNFLAVTRNLALGDSSTHEISHKQCVEERAYLLRRPKPIPFAPRIVHSIWLQRVHGSRRRISATSVFPLQRRARIAAYFRMAGFIC